MKKYFIYLIIAIAIYFLIKQIKLKSIQKGTKMEGIKQLDEKTKNILDNILVSKDFKDFNIVYSGNLDSDIVKYIQHKEGGLTDDKSDSASANTTGVLFTYKGKASKDWHTNKGITWQTFKDSIPNATADLFYKMPQNHWLDIYRKRYFAPFSNATKNPLLNYALSLWAWGSGVGGAKSLLQKVKQNNKDFDLIAEKNPDLAFKILVFERIAFYKRLADAKPQNQKFLRGWTNAHLNFYKHFKKYIQ